jgi:flagellar biosynthetic protein FlhB
VADSDQEKTEEPTERRRQEAADEGQIPRSQDLNAAVLLLASSLALSATGPGLARAMRDVMGSGLGFASAAGLTGPAAVALLRGLGWKTLAALAAFLGAMTAAALAISALQGRGTFTLQPLAPKFERIDPAKGIKKIVGVRTLVELVKSLIKLAIVGWAVWSVLRSAWPELTMLGQQPPRALLEIVRKYGIAMLTKAGTAYLVLAAADYGWQFVQHEKSLRMTKEEVKQESKNQEGDPMVKQRMRALAGSAPASRCSRRSPRRTWWSSTRCTSPSRSSTTRRSHPRLTCSPSGDARSRSASSSWPSRTRYPWSRTSRWPVRSWAASRWGRWCPRSSISRWPRCWRS